MVPFDRRELLKGALLGATALAGNADLLAQEAENLQSGLAPPRRPWDVIDVNVNLFQWPFRRLPYDAVDQLVDKLRSLGIQQAWAGSFEGLLHRDLDGVNARLAEACRRHGDGLLVPFGSVNPQLPDWEEDLRRCHETHGMPGFRLHPNYHGYTLEYSRIVRLFSLAANRKLLVQVAASMEDVRTQHPLVQVPDVDLAPLVELTRKFPNTDIVILNYRPKGAVFEQLAAAPNVRFEIARVEATDGIAQLMRSVGPNRVLFGTHAPFFIYESALIRVYESQLTDAEIGALVEHNAKRLISDRVAT